MLNNMKVGTKLAISFIMVAVVSIAGIGKMHRVSLQDAQLQENVTVSIHHIGDISVALQKASSMLRDLVEADTDTKKECYKQTLLELHQSINEKMGTLERAAGISGKPRSFNRPSQPQPADRPHQTGVTRLSA